MTMPPPKMERTRRGEHMLDVAESVLRVLARYHRYEVFGLENIPRTGGVLVIFNHSLATYDSFLLEVPLHEQLGRRFVGIADKLVFRTPVLGRIFTECGFISGSRRELTERLGAGEIIGIAPGGTREMLRGADRKYQIDWRDRLGFVWVSIMAKAPIVLAACPNGDDIFDVIPNPLTPLVYERFGAPLPLFRGRFGLPVPRPVKLSHVLSEPIYPDVAPEDATAEDAERHHAYLTERMDRLMRETRERASASG